ncbi:MAG: PGPGW domain-containing protein [Acidimicrobiia bacterium]|nr:PGPGW domain-containing protein [Acidimicrobiia bacterium]
MAEPYHPIQKPESGTVRKVAVAVGGSTVVAAGVVMLVTPGPGIIAVLAGLGILGTEFPAAKRALNKIRLRQDDPIEPDESS